MLFPQNINCYTFDVVGYFVTMWVIVLFMLRSIPSEYKLLYFDVVGYFVKLWAIMLFMSSAVPSEYLYTFDLWIILFKMWALSMLSTIP